MAGTKPWHEEDAFWTELEPILFTEQRIGAAAEQVDQVLTLLDVPPGATVLDLACGVGRHSLELARRGYRVTGVDRTSTYLKKGKERGESEGLSVQIGHWSLRWCVRYSYSVSTPTRPPNSTSSPIIRRTFTQ